MTHCETWKKVFEEGYNQNEEEDESLVKHVQHLHDCKECKALLDECLATSKAYRAVQVLEDEEVRNAALAVYEAHPRKMMMVKAAMSLIVTDFRIRDMD